MELNKTSPIGALANITLLKTTEAPPRPKHLSRGVAGLPMEQTPALAGASRGKIECDVNVDFMAYWNDPQGDRDREFVSPFRTDTTQTHYITFWQDAGRFNNIRMSMEIIFVIAAASGKTVVLPPSQRFGLEYFVSHCVCEIICCAPSTVLMRYELRTIRTMTASMDMRISIRLVTNFRSAFPC